MNAFRLPSVCPPTKKKAKVNRPCRECKYIKIYLKDDSWGYCKELDIELDANLFRPCNNFELKE